eukprot:m.67423 g.67423  ORF g.67423 m.67423 type:complete len:1434 (-) comp16628_c0_seq2:32-4333(-)
MAAFRKWRKVNRVVDAAHAFEENLDLRRRLLALSPWMDGCVENTVGTMEFPTGQRAEFIRLQEAWATEHARTVYDMLIDCWRLRPPSLLVSVTGGAANFNLPSELHTVLRDGLLKTAAFTNAWIMTGGTHSGVMKLVGSIIAGHADELSTQNHSVNIPVIGVTTWGILNSKEDIEGADKDYRKYFGTLSGPRSNRSPNPDHTHFIFVDHGKDSFGGEIRFRAELERVICEQGRCGTLLDDNRPPVSVMLVVNGGPGTLQTCRDAIVVAKTPLVVVQGSHGCADIIATAVSFRKTQFVNENIAIPELFPEFSEDDKEQLRVLIRHWLPTHPRVEDLLQMLMETTQHPHLISVFHHEHDESPGLEESVFDAIMKKESAKQANDKDGITNSERLRRIELATIWNRADVVQRELRFFVPEADQKESAVDHNPLHRLLKWALIRNRPSLVELFMENRYVDVGKFLRSQPYTTELLRLSSMVAPEPADGQRPTDTTRQRTQAELDAAMKPLDFEKYSLEPSLTRLKMQILDISNHVTQAWVVNRMDQQWTHSVHTTLKPAHPPPSPRLSMRPDLAHPKFGTVLKGAPQHISMNPAFPCSCWKGTDKSVLTELLWEHAALGDVRFHYSCTCRQVDRIIRSILALGRHIMYRHGAQVRLHKRRLPACVLTSMTPAHPNEATSSNTATFTPILYNLKDHTGVTSRYVPQDCLALLCTNEHNTWVDALRKEGWEYGEKLDCENRFHPSLKPFADLDCNNPLDAERLEYYDFCVSEVLKLLVCLGYRVQSPNNLLDLYVQTDVSPSYDFRDLVLHHDCSAHSLVVLQEAAFSRLDRTIATNDKYNYAVHNDPISEPHYCLLLWAVVTNRFELALYFWAHGDDALVRAAAAVCLFRAIANRTEKLLAEAKASLLDHAARFEKLCFVLLVKCFHADSNKMRPLLVKRYPYLGNMNSMTLAYVGYMEDFLEHPAYQKVLQAAWKGSLHPDTHSRHVLWLALVPYLAPFFLEPAQRRRRHETLWQFYCRVFCVYITAPDTVFYLDALAYVALLFIYSWVTLSPFSSTLTGLEITLLVWMVALVVDEVKQASDAGGLRLWWASGWNKLDMMMYSMYFTGMLLKADSKQHDLVKLIFALNTIVLYTRLLHVYAKSRIGPTILILYEMVNDVVIFILLLVVFLVSFGIASHALLFPDRDPDFATFTATLFRPYFQVYGELFLEQMEGESACLGDNFTSCGGTFGWFVPLLLGVYLLITNITLINLLIALFNDTYQRVASKQRKVWSFQNFELLVEYIDRSPWEAMPPPLNLLVNTVQFLVWLVRHMAERLSDRKKLLAFPWRGLPSGESASRLRVSVAPMPGVGEDTASIISSSAEDGDYRIFQKRVMDNVMGSISDIRMHYNNSSLDDATRVDNNDLMETLHELKTLIMRQQRQIDVLTQAARRAAHGNA